MRDFVYDRADSADAAQTAAKEGARAIAGGTNLLDLMKHEVETPDRLIDVNRTGLDQIEEADGGLRIGALVRNADLAAEERVRRDWPLLSRAILAGASPQIRNRATTAGNLMQRTRCAYFYDLGSACNKRSPGSGCDALNGVNRMHAILGTSEHCIATYPGDMAVALVALDAEVEIAGANGKRTVPIAEFHRLPGDRPDRDNVLEDGEIILGVTLPKPTGGAQVYRKVRDRRSYAFALVSAAVDVTVEDGKITRAALTLGSVAAKPWRSNEADKVLVGSEPSRKAFENAADRLLQGAQGHGENDYKIGLARRTLVAALAEATGIDIAGDAA
ncbi:xanthine dehydrogenase family protein subunit M [Paracoccus sp. TK19116]|uniref:Xanthine dehydrogenase family protein subunit M n=1 Tax=Paracoccus albicereus TaxID=2922394 RepID=A0ABT1MPP5_9RHOB|nr:xanthine dehydrogenase family protein subunit M [Paracoccus albicereus]MCQ0970274.1 xanthine dehydrogenase family protein subunit M [Paracoccus albicereus]